MRLKSATLLGVAVVILALFVVYRSAFQDSPPLQGELEGLDRYTELIRNWDSAEYQLLDVTGEGLGLRVSLTPRDIPTGSPGVRAKTMNALYEMQAAAGTEVSISVWLYGTDKVQRSDLLGMAYYRVLTEQTIFKLPEDIP